MYMIMMAMRVLPKYIRQGAEVVLGETTKIVVMGVSPAYAVYVAWGQFGNFNTSGHLEKKFLVTNYSVILFNIPTVYRTVKRAVKSQPFSVVTPSWFFCRQSKRKGKKKKI